MRSGRWRCCAGRGYGESCARQSRAVTQSLGRLELEQFFSNIRIDDGFVCRCRFRTEGLEMRFVIDSTKQIRCLLDPEYHGRIFAIKVEVGISACFLFDQFAYKFVHARVLLNDKLPLNPKT